VRLAALVAVLLAALVYVLAVWMPDAVPAEKTGVVEARSERPALVAPSDARADGGSRRAATRRNVGGASRTKNTSGSGQFRMAKPKSARANPSPYWRLERRYWTLSKQLGRANVERRRLTRLLAAHKQALRSLQATSRLSTIETIRLVFARYGDEAVRVADCETGGSFSPWAKNGQYENIFQMGYNERKEYGWHTVGSPVLVATLAAYRYFLATGSDWSPWSCKP
jgi:hypothetical protein